MCIKVLVCVLLLGSAYTKDISFAETVKYYENLISAETSEATTFSLPQNAYVYKPNSSDVTEYGTYDYVIVGAGSTGAVIATRLSENSSTKILLIEAGEDETPFSDIPGMFPFLQELRFNWNFKSVPQTTCCLAMVDRICPFSRGKALGGSSVINGLMYVRGNKNDYDSWAALGNPGWSYSDVLPYFRKSENSQIDGDPGYHGNGGLLNVEYLRSCSAQYSAFVDANCELGRKIVDYNGREQLGVARPQLNTLNGRRHSTGRAFLSHARSRANLKILTRSYATKVLIDEVQYAKEAYGVEFSRDGKSYVVKAAKEVIVSAGAFGSPHLLMLSGIGPAGHLKEHGIHVIKDLPVGSGMQDHPTFYGLYVNTNHSEPEQTMTETIEQYLNSAGPLTYAVNIQALGFFQTNLTNSSEVPDIEILMIPASNNSDAFIQKVLHLTDESFNLLRAKLGERSTFAFYVILLHPESRGTVRLRSSDPYDYPLIDPRFLSDERDLDIETLYQGVQLGLQMINTKALRRLNATLVDVTLPACKRTCTMGPDPAKGAVVDSTLKVHGIGRLRVADASIFPLTTSGHLNAPAVMVGGKLADMLMATS